MICYHRYALLLLLLSADLACQKSASIAPAKKILALQLDTNSVAAPNYSLPADNYTYAQILASTDSSILDTTTTITFTTDYGSFSTGGQSATVKIDLHGNASVFLKSKTAISAHVQAAIGTNYVQNIPVSFVTAFPDSLYLNLPDSANDLPETRLSWTTSLYRRLGSATAGQNVGYQAFDTAGNRIGQFYNETASDTTGNAGVQFWLNNSNYVGFVYVKAYLIVSPGDSITTRNAMYILK
jgi:hypothetical protein